MSTVLTHAGLEHGYPKATLHAAWERAAPKLDLSPTAHKYIRKIIELTSKQDYQPNSICAVFYSIPMLSLKIDMPRRSINRAEEELVRLGWIKKTCSKRGRRKGVRDDFGTKQIRWAAGVNLGPLIDRLDITCGFFISDGPRNRTDMGSSCSIWPLGLRSAIDL